MKTLSGFKINLKELTPDNQSKIMGCCNKIDELFIQNKVEWSALHRRFYKCLSSAVHLIKHQKRGTKNVEFDTFVVDKQVVFANINKLYELKNKIHTILMTEVDRVNGDVKEKSVIIKDEEPYIIQKIRIDTLDRYFRRYDLTDSYGNKLEVDNQSEWWEGVSVK